MRRSRRYAFTCAKNKLAKTEAPISRVCVLNETLTSHLWASTVCGAAFGTIRGFVDTSFMLDLDFEAFQCMHGWGQQSQTPVEQPRVRPRTLFVHKPSGAMHAGVNSAQTGILLGGLRGLDRSSVSL